MTNKLSYEYIRGLIDGEGCFTFMPRHWKYGRKQLLPAFTLAMSNRDRDLIYSVKATLGLRNKIHDYEPRIRSDGYTRSGMTILMVRDVGQLKNIIVPLCYKKLNGYKATQFMQWLEKISTEHLVPKSYKFIYFLHKSGYYDKNLKYL